MMHIMHLKSEPFKNIESGTKTVELRLYDNKRRLLDVGDDIIFIHLADDSERLAARVKALYRYASFEELFSDIAPEKCGFQNGETVEEAAASMQKYYSAKQIGLHGVLGIKIELIPFENELKILKDIDFSELSDDRYFPDGMK